jgi:hypothetical protein
MRRPRATLLKMTSFASPQTYHCICSKLIVATTYPLDQFRKLDRAIILPRPSTSTRLAVAAGLAPDTIRTEETLADWPLAGVTLLTSIADQEPLLVRSEEGIEKRYPFKCGHCKVTLGYQLDEAQYENREGRSGRRDDVVYLLEGSVMPTTIVKSGES